MARIDNVDLYYSPEDWADLKTVLLDNRYVYFESVQLKRNKRSKTEYFMLQLLNPTFSDKIKLYFNPKEGLKNNIRTPMEGRIPTITDVAIDISPMEKNSPTSSFRLKSFYVKVIDDEIFKLTSKNYFDKSGRLFKGACQEFLDNHEPIHWKILSSTILDYSDRCN